MVKWVWSRRGNHAIYPVSVTPYTSINILLDKNWNRPKHVLGMEIFCAYKTVPIRHNTNFSLKMFKNMCHS